MSSVTSLLNMGASPPANVPESIASAMWIIKQAKKKEIEAEENKRRLKLEQQKVQEQTKYVKKQLLEITTRAMELDKISVEFDQDVREAGENLAALRRERREVLKRIKQRKTRSEEMPLTLTLQK